MRSNSGKKSKLRQGKRSEKKLARRPDPQSEESQGFDSDYELESKLTKFRDRENFRGSEYSKMADPVRIHDL